MKKKYILVVSALLLFVSVCKITYSAGAVSSGIEVGCSSVNGGSKYGTVYLEPNGGRVDSKVVDIIWVALPDYKQELPVPVKTGYKFEGWYYDQELTQKAEYPYVDPNKRVHDENRCGYSYYPSVTLYAKYAMVEVETYCKGIRLDFSGKVYLNPNGGSVSPTVVDINYVAMKDAPKTELPVPVKNGYEFLGWYTDTALTNKAEYPYISWERIGTSCDYNITEPTLYAKYTKKEIPNTPPVKPITPVKPIVVTDIINNTACSNLQMIGTLKLNSMGGTIDKNVVIINIKVSEEENKIPVPTKEGYKFEGWYYEEALEHKATYPYFTDDKTLKDTNGCPVSFEMMSLYAKYEEDIEEVVEEPAVEEKKKIVFETNGGTLKNDYREITDINKYESFYLPTPSKKGYKFEGWYYDKDLKDAVGAYYKYTPEDTEDYSDIVLYAKYSLVLSSNQIGIIAVVSAILVFVLGIFLLNRKKNKTNNNSQYYNQNGYYNNNYNNYNNYNNQGRYY